MLLTQAALTILTLGALGGAATAGQQMPPGMTHEQHLKQMQKDAELEHRGADAMGFDQTVTTHHFLLTSLLLMILRQGLGVTVAGLAVGAVAARAMAETLRAFLYDVQPGPACRFRNG